MGWQTVAEGPGISEVGQTVADMDLPVGTKINAVMDVGIWEYLFDISGAEWIFDMALPDNIRVIDAHGENGQGIIEMEVIPEGVSADVEGKISTAVSVPILATLGIFLAWIRTHWIAVTIGIVILGAIVTYIRILVNLPVEALGNMGGVLIAVAAIVGVIWLAGKSGVIKSKASPGR